MNRSSRSPKTLIQWARTASAASVVLLLLLAAALPAQSSLSSSVESAAGEVTAEPVQELQASSLAEQPSVSRDEYSATSYAELLRQRYSLSYTTDWGGPIRWPFPTPSPITDRFGPRIAPCSGCSTNHMGVDFTPGAGVPIYAIADGVVSLQQEGGYYGNHVYIDHVIDGQKVRSLYAHMQWGSSPLRTGDTVKVGDFVGLVGATGMVTGAHLHLEIEIDGVKVDPFEWLRSNAS